MWKKISNLTDLDKLAQSLVLFLLPDTYLLLKGKLGVGKTALTRLIAKHLKIKQKIVSPSFTILQQYSISKNYYLNHFDFFRLSPKEDLMIFADLIIGNVNIIEWPENNPQFWQDKDYIKVEMVRKEAEIRLVKIYFR